LIRGERPVTPLQQVSDRAIEAHDLTRHQFPSSCSQPILLNIHVVFGSTITTSMIQRGMSLYRNAMPSQRQLDISWCASITQDLHCLSAPCYAMLCLPHLSWTMCHATRTCC